MYSNCMFQIFCPCQANILLNPVKGQTNCKCSDSACIIYVYPGQPENFHNIIFLGISAFFSPLRCSIGFIYNLKIQTHEDGIKKMLKKKIFQSLKSFFLFCYICSSTMRYENILLRSNRQSDEIRRRRKRSQIEGRKATNT